MTEPVTQDAELEIFFDCLPEQGKCEWRHLRGFVTRYNVLRGVSYSLVECLDVADSTKKQPEVLLESEGHPKMVIERKSVVWPEGYVARHSHSHAFADVLWKELSGRFQDDLYRLTVPESAIAGIGKKRAACLAKEISDHLARFTNSGSKLPYGMKKPIPWRFSRFPQEERNGTEPAVGICFNTVGPGVTAHAQ